jgi:dnd system-associated protein 4
MTYLRRIHRQVSHEEFVKEMTSGKSSIFKDIYQLIIFAAALGYKDRVRQPIDKHDSGKGILDSTFRNEPTWLGFVYLMGLVDSNDSCCLQPGDDKQEELIKSFEEYANYGLQVMKDKLYHSDDPLEDLMHYWLGVESESQAENYQDIQL